MNTLKLLNIAIILNALAVVLELAFALFKPDAHNSQSIIISVTLLIIMAFLRMSILSREKTNSR